MRTKTGRTREHSEAKPGGGRRLLNRGYRAELGVTASGSPIVRIVPENPGALSAHHRQVAAFLYELAAAMERRSQDLGATWAISPEAWYSRIILELGSRTEVGAADAFLQSLLSDFDLA